MNNPISPGASLKGGRYLVQALYLTGGQGRIYNGLDTDTKQRVVIKQTHHGHEWADRVMREEADLLFTLKHRSIPRAVDCFAEQGDTFLVMSRVPGSTFNELMKERRRPFTCDVVFEWGEQVLNILEYLEAQRPAVVHRDINPKNLMLTPYGQVFLLDFGIAKRLDHRTLLVGGTPHYAPPEQLKDEGTDARSDLYSLAATMYYLLTAVEPPDALSRETTLLKGLPDPLRLASDLNAEVPLTASGVLSRTLSLDRESRPTNASTMRQWLSQVKSGLADGALSSSTFEEADSEVTTLSVRDFIQVEVSAGDGGYTRADATPETRQLLAVLGQEHTIPIGLVQALIEVIDTPLESRQEPLRRYWHLIAKKQTGDSHLAVKLLKMLASGATVTPDLLGETRKALAEIVTNHTLTYRAADDLRKDMGDDESAPRRVRWFTEHAAVRRIWVRKLAVWFIRGCILSLAGQILLSLLNYGGTMLEFLLFDTLIRSLSASVSTHMLLVALVVLLAWLVHRTRDTRWNSNKVYAASCYLIGFVVGNLLIATILHDLLLVIGLIGN